MGCVSVDAGPVGRGTPMSAFGWFRNEQVIDPPTSRPYVTEAEAVADSLERLVRHRYETALKTLDLITDEAHKLDKAGWTVSPGWLRDKAQDIRNALTKPDVTP